MIIDSYHALWLIYVLHDFFVFIDAIVYLFGA